MNAWTDEVSAPKNNADEQRQAQQAQRWRMTSRRRRMTSRRRMTPRRWRGSMLVGALAIALTACSIRVDSAPRDISDDEKPAVAAVSTSIANEGGVQSTIYLLAPQAPGEPSQLRAVGRSEAPTPQNVLTALFAGPNSHDQAQRLRSALPPGTTLKRAIELSNNVLLVDVSDSFGQTVGDLLVDAVAQIVFTACDLPNVSSVELEVNGIVREWPRGDGSTTAAPLSKFDFPERNPTSQPDFPAVPSRTPDTETSVP